MKVPTWIALALLGSLGGCATVQARTNDCPAHLLQEAAALLRAGQVEPALARFAAAEPQCAGNLPFDTAYEGAATAAGRSAQAAFIQERMLNYAVADAGMLLRVATTAVEQRDFTRAVAAAGHALRLADLDPVQQARAHALWRRAYGFATIDRPSYSGFLEYGYGYDSNVRFLPDALSGGDPALATRKSSDHFHAAALGIEAAMPLGPGWGVYFGFDGRSRIHRQIDEEDHHAFDVRLGLVRAVDGGLLRAALHGSPLWWNGSRLRTLTGATVEAIRHVGAYDQVTGSVSAGRMRHPGELFEQNDYNQFELRGGWDHQFPALGTQAGVYASLGVEDDIRGRLDGDRRHAGLQARVLTEAGSGLRAYVLGGVHASRFTREREESGARRADRAYQLSSGVIIALGGGMQLRPQVSYIRQSSNVSWYSAEKLEITVHARYAF